MEKGSNDMFDISDPTNSEKRLPPSTTSSTKPGRLYLKLPFATERGISEDTGRRALLEPGVCFALSL